MECLKILFMNVCGMEMEGRDGIFTNWVVSDTGRGMKERWKVEGGREEEGKREWERRWKEGRDILEEEDVMEVSIMHLCIPDYDNKKWHGTILPSECSYTNALTICLNDTPNKDSPYQFSVYDSKSPIHI